MLPHSQLMVGSVNYYASGQSNATRTIVSPETSRKKLVVHLRMSSEAVPLDAPAGRDRTGGIPVRWRNAGL